MAVCGAADATLLVVQADATDATQLDAALEFLERANAKVIGVVLNREVDTRSSRYGRYGYGAAGRLGDST
jgi:Mrp family chromosome partitioning ATPase